ncbi:pyrimidine dimer DNA glycosylase/endonuclease V [Azoarcus sp. PA01]|nr:pyrimidine dimer DNA glycosylase/endonuclease V [Azoarcus sp. PA01]
MRLWSLHPRYLDPQGLVALWREALLARAVLRGETKGYRNHPQLDRFRRHAAPVAAINTYLVGVHGETVARGYSFDGSKIGSAQMGVQLSVTDGQISYEWRHLRQKLSRRSPVLYEHWRSCEERECHPLFVVRQGRTNPESGSLKTNFML